MIQHSSIVIPNRACTAVQYKDSPLAWPRQQSLPQENELLQARRVRVQGAGKVNPCRYAASLKLGHPGGTLMATPGGTLMEVRKWPPVEVCSFIRGSGQRTWNLHLCQCLSFVWFRQRPTRGPVEEPRREGGGREGGGRNLGGGRNAERHRGRREGGGREAERLRGRQEGGGEKG